MTTENKKTEMKVEEKKMENKEKTFASSDATKKKDSEPAKVFEEPKKTEIKVQAPRKNKAIARGVNMRISPKYSIFVCRAIMGKTPEDAIKRLEEVVKMKRPISMRSLEVPHQKGPGIAGARFPKTVCLEIIELIKQVKANAVVSGIENPVITIARADKSQGPFKRGGMRAKRAHVLIEVMDRTKLKIRNKK